MNDQYRLLEALPATRAELEKKLKLNRNAVTKRLLRLRANKLVRVIDWVSQPDGTQGKRAPVYALGDPVLDVPEPPRKPGSELNRAYRLRKHRRAEMARETLWGQLGART